MPEDIAEISARLAACADAVCRHYLPAGRRERHQWRVGDTGNRPGRSLYVRLVGPTSGKGAAGRWRDAATGDCGDLIDLIKATCRLSSTADALNEARRFLGLPTRKSSGNGSAVHGSERAYDPATSIARLLAQSQPISGTLAEAYLRQRGIERCSGHSALRFHPNCPCRDLAAGRFSQRPALLALVTNIAGDVTGLHRTYLSPDGCNKADIAAPRRSLGAIGGNGVRFGGVEHICVYGEGIETVLSLKCAVPNLPMVAALSADNLGASTLPATLRRLYIALDRDDAGFRGAGTLSARAKRADVEIIRLIPRGEDFNADLTEHGLASLSRHLATQMAPQDLVFGRRIGRSE